MASENDRKVSLEAFIWNKPTESGVREFRSLHILVPNDEPILDGRIRIQFQFRTVSNNVDDHKETPHNELSFTCIGSYDCDNSCGQPCDAYYFLPDPPSQLMSGCSMLPPDSYPDCPVVANAFPCDHDDITIQVVALVG